MKFDEILKFRHACKVFDENKKISDDEFDKIIEAGRISPSSMGLEPWDFWLIKDESLRLNLKKVCWNQAQFSTASHILVVFAKIKDLKINSQYVREMVERRVDKNSQEHDAFIEKINNFLKNNIGQSDLEIYAWTKAQCFLAAQNMMNMAANLGIDSCPIEGFSSADELQKVLNVDIKDKRVALILTFGYRKNNQPKKIRRKKEEILTIK